MEIRKKAIILTAATVIFAMIFFAAALKGYLLFKYPETYLKQAVTDFFKLNIDRAVLFEEIHLSLLGNVTLTKFRLSASSDFNDNINLIISPEVKITLNFMDLSAGRSVVEEIHFINADVSFLKLYEKHYQYTLDSIINLIITGTKNPSKFNKNNFFVKFSNTKISYAQFIDDERFLVKLNDVDFKIHMKDSIFNYRFSGDVEKNVKSVMSDGYIYLKGEYSLAHKTFRNDINLNNIDLSYFNHYLREHDIKYHFQGGVSVDLDYFSKKQGFVIDGRLETNNLHVASLSDSAHNLISNENLNIVLDADILDAETQYTIRKFQIFDDTVDFGIKGTYKKESMIDLQFSSGIIDLEDLSVNFSPYKGMSYGGKASVKGSIKFDIAKKKDTGSSFSLSMEELSCAFFDRKRTKEIISDGKGGITYGSGLLNVKLGLASGTSDLTIRSTTTVKNWSPFQSDTGLSFLSKNMQWDIVYNASVKAVQALVEQAYLERKRGWDDIYFFKRPIGIFVLNNNIACDLTVNNFLLGERANIRGFSLKTDMTNGFLSLKEFASEGYDGVYELTLQGNFNSDVPFFNVKGKVSNFDMERFYKDYGIAGSLTGRGGIDFNYEVNSYCLAQLLDNSKGDFTFSMNNGTLKNSPLQKKLGEFFKTNGIEAPVIRNLEFTGMTFNVGLYGDLFNVQNFTFQGDVLNFTSYGKYLFNEGIDLPIPVSLKSETAVQTIQVKLQGPLLAPCLSLISLPVPGVKSKELCF